MTRAGKRILSCLAAFALTGVAQRVVLNALGHRLGRGASIGWSLILVDLLCLDEDARIGHFNVIACRRIVLRRRAFLRSFNWARGRINLSLGRDASIGKGNRIVKARGSATTAHVRLDPGAAVSLGHYLNADDHIRLGWNAVLAGLHTQVWTHGFVHLADRRTRARIVGPVRIGANAYIGSRCVINPNVRIGDDVTLASGASVARDLIEPGLYAPGPLRHVARNPEERLADYVCVSSRDAGGHPVYRRPRGQS